MISNPMEAIQSAIESILSESVNTSMPGTIVSYDAARNRAVVRPDMPKRLDNEESLDPPNIVEVPIVWPASGGGNASFTMPLKPGDGVMLSFQQRSIEGWLSGKKTMPDDPRQFDLSDCVAIAGCQPNGTVAHSENVVLKFGEGNLTFHPDNKVILGNGNGNLTFFPDGMIVLGNKAANITLYPNGTISMSGNGNISMGNANAGITMDSGGGMTQRASTITINTAAKTFVLETHLHSGVNPGGSNTGKPV